MALTRSFRETVVARARRDPVFRAALVEEAVQAIIDGDTETGTVLLRDAINATVGFRALSEATAIPEKSLMRMVGPHGNPRLDSIGRVLKALRTGAGVRVQAHAEPEAESA